MLVNLFPPLIQHHVIAGGRSQLRRGITSCDCGLLQDEIRTATTLNTFERDGTTGQDRISLEVASIAKA